MFDDLKDGIREAKRGNTKLGIKLLEGFAAGNGFPEAKAWYGYCLANERQNFSAGISLCKDALNSDPLLSDGYLALARIYLLRKQRKFAIEALQQGMKVGQDRDISTLLSHLGIRKKPVIPFLSRNNVLNVALGRMMASLKLR